MTKPLLCINDLKVYFPKYGGIFRKLLYHVKAVDGVSLSVEKGKTTSLVGESGCGKTTTGKSILSLVPITQGKIEYRGEDITRLKEKNRKRIARHIQIIFQDPYGSLNPKMSIGQIIDEAVHVRYEKLPAEECAALSKDLLKRVGLHQKDYSKYPHEFSGGQRQRIGIARAIAAEPEFIICDESVSALDVSIQADIINLLKDLQNERNLTYLFIAHDLSVVKYISDTVSVMYLGRIVEQGQREEIFDHPLHPYTIALLSSVPRISKEPNKRILLEGDVPSPVNIPPGCPFHPRCWMAKPECASIEVLLNEITPEHFSACPYGEEIKKPKG